MTHHPKSRALDVDRYVGRRIAQRRKVVGITQQQLADAIGVSYQQVSKVERGVNRIAAGRLHRAAVALEVDVGWFFEGFDDAGEGLPPRYDPRAEQLMCDAASIGSRKEREALSHLARALASDNVP